MARPRKSRPTFDAPKPPDTTTPAPIATPTWAYRTDVAPVDTPAPPLASAPITPSVLNRMVTTPLMVGALLVLVPLTWLAGPSRSR